jgi:hypothetical protein
VDVAPAVRVERRGAVGTQDPEVLEPMVVVHPVHVIEDQRHVAATPLLALSAQLALTGLEALGVEPLLELDARERRPFDEDLLERPSSSLISAQGVTAGGVRVEVVDRNSPDLERIPLQRPPVAAAGAHVEAA